MTAGDTPQSLADLIRRVGQLEALRAAPPLSLQTGPAGSVLSLIGADQLLMQLSGQDPTPANKWGWVEYAAFSDGSGSTGVKPGGQSQLYNQRYAVPMSSRGGWTGAVGVGTLRGSYYEWWPLANAPFFPPQTAEGDVNLVATTVYDFPITGPGTYLVTGSVTFFLDADANYGKVELTTQAIPEPGSAYGGPFYAWYATTLIPDGSAFRIGASARGGAITFVGWYATPLLVGGTVRLRITYGPGAVAAASAHVTIQAVRMF